MGLTGNQSANLLLNSLNEFKEEVRIEFEKINKKLEILEEIAFKGEILREEDKTWDIIRLKRDYLLKSTDWVMTPGSTLNQTAWAEYRQFLRDLPQTYAGAPTEVVVWPEMPSFVGPNTNQVE
jgi:hypothetical protein